LSIEECPAARGCDFTLEAKEGVQALLQTHNHETSEKKAEFHAIRRQFKKKGKMLETVYLQKEVQKGKSFRVNINTPNAIVYASSPKKCELPG
jgi:hypothetical protein